MTWATVVIAAVNKMAAYPDSYHGVIFIGDESRAENNNACLSHYSDFRLTLKYVPGKL